MGKIYDGLDAATKELANIIKKNNPDFDEDMAAIAAHGGEGAADIIKTALTNAKAAGMAEATKRGNGSAKTARVEEIKKQIAAMEAKHKEAADARRHVEMVSAKNRITALRNELNTLTTEK